MRRAYTYFGLLFLALFLFLSSSSIVYARPLDPTLILTCTDLENIATDATTTIYFLGNNIDCSGIASFTPIPNFQTTLNGNGFTISNLTITGFSNGHALFSNTNGATIENLKMTNASVQTNFIGGILIGNAASTTISNVSVQGSIVSGAALSLTGGLVGDLSNSTVTNCSANVTSNIGYSIFGGLIGTIPSTSTVSSSYAIGNISIFSDAGNSELGGLVGDNIAGTIANSYANVSLSATGNIVGGLVGKNEGAGQIINSYSAGSVNGISNLGGLVGYTTSTATTTNSYWDTQTSGRATSAGGTGTTTARMQTQSTFTGWDFNNIWSITSGNYPTLQGIDVIAPSNPGTPTTTSPTNNNKPTVTWTASTDTGGLALSPYTIQWSTSSDFSGTVFSYNARPLSGPNSPIVDTFFTPTSSLADGTWYFRVQARDLAGNVSAFSTSSAVLIDATAPVITLLGGSIITQMQGSPFIDPGATASDAIDGNITAHIAVTGVVNSNALGTYILTYTVSDSAGNSALVYRTVIVQSQGGGSGSGSWGGGILPTAQGEPQNPLTVLINGSKDSPYYTTSQTVTLTFNANPTTVQRYIISLQPDFNNAHTDFYTSSTSFTLPPTPGTYTLYIKFYSTTGLTSDTISRSIIYTPSSSSITSTSISTDISSIPQSPSSPHYYFSRNLRRGMSGRDVQELQKFLNSHGFTLSDNGPGSPGQETLYFGSVTMKALKKFQETYAEQLLSPLKLTTGTGLLMNTTRTFINQNF